MLVMGERKGGQDCFGKEIHCVVSDFIGRDVLFCVTSEVPSSNWGANA